MLDRLRENIERLAIGDPLQFYMLVGLLALLVLAMLLVAFTDTAGESGKEAGSHSGSDSGSHSGSRKKSAKKASPADRTLKMARNSGKSGAKSVREKTASAKAASSKKKAGKKAAAKADQQEIPADFALLRRDSEQPADGPPALARLTEIEQEMLALRDLFQSGKISRETYVTDSRALFDEAEKLADQA